jgi:hypothetical protein
MGNLVIPTDARTGTTVVSRLQVVF